MNEPNRRADIDIARGGALMMVVFLHATMYVGFSPSSAVDRVNSLTALARMPLMLLLSGVLAGGLLHRPMADAKRRFLDQGWLLLLWIPFSLVARSLHDLTRLSLGDFVAEIIGPRYDLWYIWVLGLGCASLAAMRPSWRAPVVGSMAIVSTLNFAGVLRSDVLAYDRIAQFGVFFYAGAFFRSELFQATSRNSVARPLCAAALLVPIDLYGNVLVARFGWEVLGLVEAALTCAFLLLAAGAVQHIRGVNATLGRIGRNTLPIYLAHPPMFFLIERWSPTQRWSADIGVPVAVVAVVAASLMLEALLKAGGMGWLYARPPGLGRRIAERAQAMAAYVADFGLGVGRTATPEGAQPIFLGVQAAPDLPSTGNVMSSGAVASLPLSIHEARPGGDHGIAASAAGLVGAG